MTTESIPTDEELAGLRHQLDELYEEGRRYLPGLADWLARADRTLREYQGRVWAEEVPDDVAAALSEHPSRERIAGLLRLLACRAAEAWDRDQYPWMSDEAAARIETEALGLDWNPAGFRLRSTGDGAEVVEHLAEENHERTVAYFPRPAEAEAFMVATGAVELVEGHMPEGPIAGLWARRGDTRCLMMAARLSSAERDAVLRYFEQPEVFTEPHVTDRGMEMVACNRPAPHADT